MPAKSKVKRGDAISVDWPTEPTWCDGRVKTIDVDSVISEILYNDVEGEVLNFFKEKYKFKAGGKEEELIDRVLAGKGDVSKQPGRIGDFLRDMSDRADSAEWCSDRKRWWFDWYFGIASGVEAGDWIPLAKVFYDLSCRLRPSVLTAIWTAEIECWQQRLRSTEICEGLVCCLEDQRNKAVHICFILLQTGVLMYSEMVPSPSFCRCYGKNLGDH